MSFNRFIMEEQYKKVKGLGDRLVLMKQQINWKPFIPLVKSVFYDDKKQGGRPHTDELIVVRSMLLQAWYNLSDPELEFQCHDRLSFRNFLGFPEKIPDFTTIWKIRDRLEREGMDTLIWAELQKQLDDKGFKIKKGTIQDAAFIEADRGKKRHRKEKEALKKGETVEYTDKQKKHMDKDGSFSVKHGQVHYGYKSHIKLDVNYHLIRELEVTTASVHDSKVDLSEHDEVIYRDRGYTGKETKAKGNGSMKRGNLTIQEKLRNKRIARRRAPGERPFSVVKRTFHGERTQVKTLPRVRVKEMFKYFAYDLYQLVTLERKRISVS
jgi:transposase, IS5 family